MQKFIRKSLDLVYDSKIVALYKDTLETPDGRTVVYDYIKHKSGGGAGVLLVDDNECIYLIKQYRNSLDDITLEIPAGGYSAVGEAGEVCAVREAEEETGFIPTRVYHVANAISSVGTFDEKTDIFIGTHLVTGKQKLDPDEFVEVVHMPLDEALRLVYKGAIIDSKTILALFAYKEYKREGIIE